MSWLRSSQPTARADWLGTDAASAGYRGQSPGNSASRHGSEGWKWSSSGAPLRSACWTYCRPEVRTSVCFVSNLLASIKRSQSLP